ncbi:MAG: 30S ribosomal protein S16 [Candidatus Magasanikbacteria bacterium]|uniref:Small ribosomal subunit protein bS16 n=1 Tax=Candidatus Magasanikbacteria bacterium CG10_big_fil_rev_8_21_14_0_10_38_6 TaxID=1974647 RepID=A0A2M6P188_9BACT|nr:30S ribosomal protein S16 [Candidatus Magasanikbacteria bacterium]NCS72447.1 30S ribosomal protein S16 [Candidatus Magasanikbacteria bacterium]PIR77502.1 MAG: 30S ribosomal protein S16 [Candidatus Magasanikbacteria bacterium CG10_big_fil_rev_8_21_14_0_10_38_6]
MLRIRFQRMGRKKKPSYRVIVSEKHKDTQAGSLEILGTYNAIEQPKIIQLNIDRIKHWLSVGAQPSPAVHNLFVREGILEGKKQKSVFITNKRQAKLGAKKVADEEAKKAKEEAAKAEAEAKKVAAEEAKAAVDAATTAEESQTE